MMFCWSSQTIFICSVKLHVLCLLTVTFETKKKKSKKEKSDIVDWLSYQLWAVHSQNILFFS